MYYTWLYMITQYQQTTFNPFTLKETFFCKNTNHNCATGGKIYLMETSRQIAWRSSFSTYPPPFN